MDVLELPYENVKELLVKMAAFIGETVCERCSYEWVFPDHFKEPAIVGGRNISPLKAVVNAWKYKCSEESWQFLEWHEEVLKESMRK